MADRRWHVDRHPRARERLVLTSFPLVTRGSSGRAWYSATLPATSQTGINRAGTRVWFAEKPRLRISALTVTLRYPRSTTTASEMADAPRSDACCGRRFLVAGPETMRRHFLFRYGAERSGVLRISRAGQFGRDSTPRLLTGSDGLVRLAAPAACATGTIHQASVQSSSAARASSTLSDNALKLTT